MKHISRQRHVNRLTSLVLDAVYAPIARTKLNMLTLVVLVADACGEWNMQGDYPWLALMYANDDTLVAVGTIIARRWLLMQDTGIE